MSWESAIITAVEKVTALNQTPSEADFIARILILYSRMIQLTYLYEERFIYIFFSPKGKSSYRKLSVGDRYPCFISSGGMTFSSKPRVASTDFQCLR